MVSDLKYDNYMEWLNKMEFEIRETLGRVLQKLHPHPCRCVYTINALYDRLENRWEVIYESREYDKLTSLWSYERRLLYITTKKFCELRDIC